MKANFQSVMDWMPQHFAFKQKNKDGRMIPMQSNGILFRQELYPIFPPSKGSKILDLKEPAIEYYKMLFEIIHQNRHQNLGSLYQIQQGIKSLSKKFDAMEDEKKLKFVNTLIEDILENIKQSYHTLNQKEFVEVDVKSFLGLTEKVDFISLSGEQAQKKMGSVFAQSLTIIGNAFRSEICATLAFDAELASKLFAVESFLLEEKPSHKVEWDIVSELKDKFIKIKQDMEKEQQNEQAKPLKDYDITKLNLVLANLVIKIKYKDEDNKSAFIKKIVPVYDGDDPVFSVNDLESAEESLVLYELTNTFNSFKLSMLERFEAQQEWLKKPSNQTDSSDQNPLQTPTPNLSLISSINLIKTPNQDVTPSPTPNISPNANQVKNKNQEEIQKAQEFFLKAFGEIKSKILTQKGDIFNYYHSEKALIGFLLKKIELLVSKIIDEIKADPKIKVVEELEEVSLHIFSTRDTCYSCETFLSQPFVVLYQKVLQALRNEFKNIKSAKDAYHGITKLLSFKLEYSEDLPRCGNLKNTKDEKESNENAKEAKKIKNQKGNVILERKSYGGNIGRYEVDVNIKSFFFYDFLKSICKTKKEEIGRKWTYFISVPSTKEIGQEVGRRIKDKIMGSIILN